MQADAGRTAPERADQVVTTPAGEDAAAGAPGAAATTASAAVVLLVSAVAKHTAFLLARTPAQAVAATPTG